MKQLGIAFDQFLNCLFSLVIGGGWADESLSARCYREGKTSKAWDAARATIDALLWLDPQHCFASYLAEAERQHLPEEYRGKNG